MRHIFDSGVVRGSSNSLSRLVALLLVVTLSSPVFADLLVAGSNSYGQLGIGGGDASLVTIPVPALIGNVRTLIAGGDSFYLAIKDDGSLWSWGRNDSGQLGDGTTSSRFVPVKLPTLTNVIAAAASSSFCLAVKSDGTVWQWGYNSGLVNSRTPVQVQGLSGVVAVAAGRSHALALKSDGTLWGWGANTSGEVGDGTNYPRATPVQVSSLSNIIGIGAGERSSLAITADGTLLMWGDNAYGQLGEPGGYFEVLPAPVSGISGVVSATTGFSTTVALADGSVWSWGRNLSGELGDGTVVSRYAPAVIPGLNRIVEVAGTHALDAGGQVWGWGSNLRGEVGDGTTTQRLSPVRVTGLTGVVSLGRYNSALRSDRSAWVWGDNTWGQIGDGIRTARCRAIRVARGEVLAIAAGGKHSLFVPSDGTVWAFGSNSDGQLGDGTTTIRRAPVQVTGLSGVRSIAAGFAHSAAITSDGAVWTWGDNAYGQLGDGTNVDRLTPVRLNLADVKQLACGATHTLALKADGTVWAWGSAALGNGGTPSATPVQVPGLTSVTAIAAGQYHSLAVKSDGTLWVWGSNIFGQLGVQGVSSVTAPMNNPSYTRAVAVAAGDRHSLVLTSDGLVSGMGDDTYGQRLTSLSSSNIAIACGAAHSLTAAYGGIWGAGLNNAGQLADGTYLDSKALGQATGVSGSLVAAGESHTLIVGTTTNSLVQGNWPAKNAQEHGVTAIIVTLAAPVLNLSADDLTLSGGRVVSVRDTGRGNYLFTVSDLPSGVITATLDGDITDSTGADLPAYRWSFTNVPRSITSWQSMRKHNGAEFGVTLNPSSTGNGSAGPTVDPRGTPSHGGLSRIRVTFDGPAILQDPAGVSVTCWTTVNGAAGSPQMYTPTVSMTDTTHMDIALSGIPDASCCRIEIGPGTLADALTGDTDCLVRALMGDVTGNGNVDVVDMALVKSKLGQASSLNPALDVNLSGRIDVVDMAIAKSRLAKNVICP